MPTARDLDEHRGRLPSKSLYWHTFGSLTNALREAGFDVPVGEERLERAIDQGVALARELGRLPRFADWAEARERTTSLLTEWQVYRMFDARRGAVVDVPVPRPRAALEAGPGRRGRRNAAAAELRRSRGDRGEAREAELALARRPDGRQGVLLDVAAVGAEARVRRDDAPSRERRGTCPSRTSRLAAAARPRTRSTISSAAAGRGEEELVAAAADPERPADAAGEEDAFPARARRATRPPSSRERLERARIVLRVRGEREDRLGVDGHPRLGAGAGVAGEELVVVQDDPVVDPDDRAVADGMVVGGDRGMALRVVADVDEELGPRASGTAIRSSSAARGRALLRDHWIRVVPGRGRRTRRRRRRARRSRPAAPAQRASGRRRSESRGYIRRFRT